VELFDGNYKTFSYVNFYACNAGLLVPQFGDANDGVVLEILSRAVTDRKVMGLDAKAIVLGGGVFNCLTQQVPAI
jgi:agmatine deiminase